MKKEKYQMKKNRRLQENVRAFTLIELLIVVAIIAILAAIAVPNFLEAQVRSKVSRCQTDQRTLSVALESYFVDSNTYPPDHDNAQGDPSRRWKAWDGSQENQVGLFYLTTPMSYLASLPRDPFALASKYGEGTVGGKIQAFLYVLASGSDNGFQGGKKTAAYMLFGMGPDSAETTGGQDNWPDNCSNLIFYDPSNGTKSIGDVFRFAGDYLSGNWTVYSGSGETPHGLWTVKTTMP